MTAGSTTTREKFHVSHKATCLPSFPTILTIASHGMLLIVCWFPSDLGNATIICIEVIVCFRLFLVTTDTPFLLSNYHNRKTICGCHCLPTSVCNGLMNHWIIKTTSGTTTFALVSLKVSSNLVPRWVTSRQTSLCSLCLTSRQFLQQSMFYRLFDILLDFNVLPAAASIHVPTKIINKHNHK
jgi:hypothetical protein